MVWERSLHRNTSLVRKSRKPRRKNAARHKGNQGNALFYHKNSTFIESHFLHACTQKVPFNPIICFLQVQLKNRLNFSFLLSNRWLIQHFGSVCFKKNIFSKNIFRVFRCLGAENVFYGKIFSFPTSKSFIILRKMIFSFHKEEITFH